MAGRWVGGMRGLCIRGPLHTSSPLLKLGRLGLGLPTQRVVASVEAEAQKSRAAEDGWSPKSPRPVLRPRQDGRCGQRAPALHPACCTPGGLGFCLPDSLPAVPAARSRTEFFSPGATGISGLHSRLTRGDRPRLKGNEWTPLSSRVATGIPWSPRVA